VRNGTQIGFSHNSGSLSKELYSGKSIHETMKFENIASKLNRDASELHPIINLFGTAGPLTFTFFGTAAILTPHIEQIPYHPLLAKLSLLGLIMWVIGTVFVLLK
jgi:hypothetical protein